MFFPDNCPEVTLDDFALGKRERGQERYFNENSFT